MTEYTIRTMGGNSYSIDRLKGGDLVMNFVVNINHAQVLEFVAVHVMAGVTIIWEDD